MTAPDRPTREAVERALTLQDGSVLAAEVRALRAELVGVIHAAGEHPDVPYGELLAELRRLVENDQHCIEKHGAALVARTPQPAAAPTTFEIDGVLRSQQSEPDDDPQQQCRCCRPRGHVYAFGIDLPFEVPGTRGPVAAHPSDWISRALYAHRFEDGRKVRLTLTLDPTYAPPLPAEGNDGPDECYAEAVGMPEHCRGSACMSEMCAPHPAEPADPRDAEFWRLVQAGYSYQEAQRRSMLTGAVPLPAVPDGAVVGAARDLVGHTDRMLNDWAEMRPREGMSAEKHEQATALRARVLWAPLHSKADTLRQALDAVPDGADAPARRRTEAEERASLLRHYLAAVAARIGRSDLTRQVVPSASSVVIEEVGEAVLAEIERQREGLANATSNLSLSVNSSSDGEDVPARLDAAADTLAPFDRSKDSSARQAERHLRRAADWLNYTSSAARAAVAAALARPTGGTT